MVKVAQLGIDRVAKSLQKSFDDTAIVLNELCLTIKDFRQVHTHHFITLYEKKQAIEGNVLRLLTAYDNQVSLEKAIKEAEEEVVAVMRTQALYKDFRTTRRSKWYQLESTNYHNTLCGYSDCHSNCHIGCGCMHSFCFDKETFKNCVCMRGTDTCRTGSEQGRQIDKCICHASMYNRR